MRRPPDRPLEWLPTLKLKASVVILAAVAITVITFWSFVRIGLWPSISGIIAGAVALSIVWVLARGMTSPLREMAQAIEAMARGDFSSRVRATSRDEIGALARAFNQMAAELAETDRVRRDLVANVSHELRTPITALQARLENIIDGVEEPDPETLQTMLAQVERLGRLVQQLLDLSRLESGTVPLERREFDVEPMLQHAVRESQLQSPNVAMTVEVDPDDLTLEADPERLHQVVANLVENAVRHSPAGGKVAVAAHDAGDAVQFEVSDDGPGISDSDKARVFERFYRADSARSSRNGGAGLGLAIAQWIVDLHGGEIHPERREPHGCRMVVTIPNRRDGNPAPREPAMPRVSA
ncbi:MAG: histidine kinase with domain [Actinomycetia bacterium]|nr:histidine kinase with domain [Actinomycetes bacterium]